MANIYIQIYISPHWISSTLYQRPSILFSQINYNLTSSLDYSFRYKILSDPRGEQLKFLSSKSESILFVTGERWSVKRRSSRFVYLRSVIYDRPLSVQPSAASGDTVIPFTHGLCQSIPTTIMARLNSAVRLVPACYFDLIRTNSSRNVSIGRFRFREGGMIPSSEGEEEMAHTILWFIIGSEKLAHTFETRSLRTRDVTQKWG